MKLYATVEPDALDLQRALGGRTDLAVSDLAITEVVSALARRAREGAVPGGVPLEVAREIRSHTTEDGIFARVELVPAIFEQAERLLAGAVRRLRAADAIHVSAAKAAGARSICTYDRRQATAAVDNGLRAWPPLD